MVHSASVRRRRRFKSSSIRAAATSGFPAMLVGRSLASSIINSRRHHRRRLCRMARPSRFSTAVEHWKVFLEWIPSRSVTTPRPFTTSPSRCRPSSAAYLGSSLASTASWDSASTKFPSTSCQRSLAHLPLKNRCPNLSSASSSDTKKRQRQAR